jgi:alkylation response protein AidB-like acyl-CoA dehydrogenase
MSARLPTMTVERLARAAGLDTEERLLLESFSRFAEAELRPLADRWAEGPVLDAKTARELLQRIDEFGLVSGLVPEARGGSGLGFVVYGLLCEELARVWPDLTIVTVIQALGAAALEELAPPELRASHVEPALRGERLVCMCISEPAVGSNVAEVQTRAEKVGDGWVIRGQKLWISNGTLSDSAIVVCRTGEGLSLLLADREHGYTSRDVAKMGLHAAPTSELLFDGVRVPAHHLIGGEGSGLQRTLRLFERARVFVGLTSVGIARAALEEAVAYAVERRQHGKAIGAHQIIQAYLAETATEIDAARLLCLRALHLLEQDVRCDTESAMAKWWATEMAVRATSKALQVHGGFGITKEHAVERHFRNARIMTIPDGTTEIQKLIIGRSLTGLAAFS